MRKNKDAYLEFAGWRINKYRAEKPRQSVRFFRRSRNHSLFWNFVMHCYYSSKPLTVSECEKVTSWSRPTTRKLLAEAVSKGFMEIRQVTDDHRKRLVFPTKMTVNEYEAMVEGYLLLWEGLRRKTGRARGPAGSAPQAASRSRVRAARKKP